MLQNSRGRLLAYYSIVMAAILILFSIALSVTYIRDIYYRELDSKLENLARAAAPSFIRIQAGEKIDDWPREDLEWRDIFDKQQQSLEWFDSEGKLLASQGNRLKLGFSPAPKKGFWELKGKPALDRYQIRTFTIQVSIDRSSLNQAPLEGYVRSGETTEILQEKQKQFLGLLFVSILGAFGIVAISGLWLTQKALEPVQRSFQQLQQFTADASHELRSPLTVMRTSIDVMRDHPERFEPKDFKKLNALASATDQMTHLTEDLLLLARTEGVREVAPGEWRRIPLQDLLEDSIEWHEPIAEKKQISLEFNDLAQIYLWGDSSQLSRLFGNLLENAIQYTPLGGRVSLRLARRNQSAVVDVEDTGIGIAPDQLKLIFDRLWRAEQARDYRQEGTGLGLAIAQAIAGRHGGHIEVRSQVSKGSCFQVILPLGRSNSPRQQQQWTLNTIIQKIKAITSQNALIFLKKVAVFATIILLLLLPIWLVQETLRQTSIFQGIFFPNGRSSFADAIVVEKNITPASNPAAVLGIPNSGRSILGFFLDSHRNDVTFRPKDRITVQFTDNLLTGSGDSQPDLWIFFKGQSNPTFLVEISKDREKWSEVGQVTSENGGIDIDRKKWGEGDFFPYVRLTYLASNDGKSLQSPVYLDSIGAISSVSLTRVNNDWWWLFHLLFRLVLLGLAIYAGFYWLKHDRRQRTPSQQ